MEKKGNGKKEQITSAGASIGPAEVLPLGPPTKPHKRRMAIVMGTLIIASIAVIIYFFLFYLIPIIIALILGLAGIKIDDILFLFKATGILASPVIAFFVAWLYLAPNRRFFVFVKEGTAVIVTKGGQYVETIIRWKGHYVDDDGEVRELKEGENDPRYLFGGFCYFGFYPIKKIHLYQFEWTGVKYDYEGKGGLDKHPKQVLYYIPLRPDVYYKKISDAEDKKGLPIDMGLMNTMQITNPRKSRFNVENWLETVSNKIAGVGVRVAKTFSYQEWLSKKEKKGETMEKAAPLEVGETISDQLMKEKILEEEFKQKYGIMVLNIKTLEFSPNEAYRKATTQKYIAEQNKKATKVNAQAEAYKKIKEAEGESKAAEQKFAIYEKSKNGIILRMLEVFEQMSKDKGTKWVLSMPQATQLFSDILKKPADQINPQELTSLLPVLIEELREKTEDKDKKTNKKSKKKKDDGEEDDGEEDDGEEDDE